MPTPGIHDLLTPDPNRVDLESKLGANLKGTWIRISFLKVVHSILNLEKRVLRRFLTKVGLKEVLEEVICEP